MDRFMEVADEEARMGAAEDGIPTGAALADREGRLQPRPTPTAILPGQGKAIDIV